MLLTGCSPLLMNAQPDPNLRTQPERFIVLTIANHPQPLLRNAASSLPDTITPTAYGISGEANATARAIARDHQLTAVAAWPITVLQVHCLVYRIPDNQSLQSLLTELSTDTRVSSVQPLQTFYTQTTQHSIAYNDTYAGLQNNLQQLAVPQAQRLSKGEGIKIALIDTGVDTTHPDLKGRIAQTRNFVDNDPAQFLRDAHGTALAGVIAAVTNNHQGIAGIAPAAKLLALKACWQIDVQQAAQCNSFTLAQALSAAIEAKVQLVNLSLAGPSDPLLTRLVETGLKRGMIFIAAAPNDLNANSFPTTITDVIRVEASEHHSTADHALAAPGTDIFTLSPAGHYNALSGSSLATAQVTGVAALLLARMPHTNTQKLFTALLKSSNTLITNDTTLTSINACKAMDQLSMDTHCSALHTN